MPVGQEPNYGKISFSSCPHFSAFLAKTNGVLEEINSFAKAESSSQISGTPQEKRRLGNEIIFGLMKNRNGFHAFSLLGKWITLWWFADSYNSLVFVSLSVRYLM